jgi:hypothetical protein
MGQLTFNNIYHNSDELLLGSKGGDRLPYRRSNNTTMNPMGTMWVSITSCRILRLEPIDDNITTANQGWNAVFEFLVGSGIPQGVLEFIDDMSLKIPAYEPKTKHK